MIEDGLGELIHGHIGATPGAVDSEEAEADGAELLRATVEGGEQLVGLLGGRVHVTRSVGRLGQSERYGGRLTIHAGAGGINQLHILGE